MLSPDTVHGNMTIPLQLQCPQYMLIHNQMWRIITKCEHTSCVHTRTSLYAVTCWTVSMFRCARKFQEHLNTRLTVNLVPAHYRLSRNAEPRQTSRYALQSLNSFLHMPHLTWPWRRYCQCTFSWVTDAAVLVPFNIIAKANIRSFCFMSADALLAIKDLPHSCLFPVSAQGLSKHWGAQC
jgi:hypothetical protein